MLIELRPFEAGAEHRHGLAIYSLGTHEAT